MSQDNSKQRKPESQKIFEEADNAGRFSGNDNDAKAAKQQATENIQKDTNTASQTGGKNLENTDAEARRDPAQVHDYKGESQNVNDDNGRPLNEEELRNARNKANEGK